MAEAPKEFPPSVKPKEKFTLDDDTGKEFLNSWKKTSATNDAMMDFNFDSVPSGKKNKFEFDKLDMDFNFDAGFDKLSSFKVDVPDFDFTSSPKKSAKGKEGSGEESSKRSHQGKKDCFDFSFDFNELGNFDFDSSLMTGKKSSMKNLDPKPVAVEEDDPQGSQKPMEEVTSYEKLTTNLQESEFMATAHVEISVDEHMVQNSLPETPTSESGAPETLAVLYGEQNTQVQTAADKAGEIAEQSHVTDNASSLELSSKQTTQNVTVMFPNQNSSTQKIVLDMRTEARSHVVEENIKSGGECHIGDELTPAIEPPSLCATGFNEPDRRNSSSDIANGKSYEAEPTKADLNLLDTSLMNITVEKPDVAKADRKIKSSSPKVLQDPLESEALLTKLIPAKEREPLVTYSKYFRKLENRGCELQQPSSNAMDATSYGNKNACGIHTPSINEKVEGLSNTEEETRSIVMVNSDCKDVTDDESNMLGSDKNIKIGRDDGLGEDTIGDGKLEHPLPLDKEGEKGESVDEEKHSKNHKVLDSEVSATSTCSVETRKNFQTQTSINPSQVLSTMGIIHNSDISIQSMRTGKKTPDVSSLKISSVTCSTDNTNESKMNVTINPRLVVSSAGSVHSSSIISVEGLKAVKKPSDLSSLKISRTIGLKRGQSLAILEKEMNPVRSSEKPREVLVNTASKIVRPVHSIERKMPLMQSLKRKTLEVSGVEYVPVKLLKRLSTSPNINRKPKDSSEAVVGEVFNQEKLMELKASDCPTSSLQRPLGDMIEQEVSIYVEDGVNAGKAETYTRELEDMCNVLKKKHDEAKEIFVRAVVNNNNLLMLNHPMYEEKLGLVQNNATRIMSKHLQSLQL